jgi:hypothetical protein
MLNIPDGFLKFNFEYSRASNLIWGIPEGFFTFHFEYSREATSNFILNFPKGCLQFPLLKFHCLLRECVTFCENTSLLNSTVVTFLTHSFVIINYYVHNTSRTSFTPLCYTPFFSNAHCQFTPLLNLRSRIFGWTSFGWLRSITLKSYFWWEYVFFIYDFFMYALLFWERN